MEIRRHLPGIAIVGALLAGFAWLVLRPHEPVYRGKPLSFWLEAADVSAVYQHEIPASPAELALRAQGTNTIPLLLKMARTPLYGFRRMIGWMARDDGSSFLHLPPQLYKHDVAVWGFRLLRGEARPAVPELSRLLSVHDRDLQISGLECLAAIGPDAAEAVPEILNCFEREAAASRKRTNSTDLMVYSAAAYALGEIGPAASNAIPKLVAETNEPAQIALLRIRGDSLDGFFQRLRDTTNQATWQRAASEIYRLGRSAEPAVPYLVTSLTSTNEAIQMQAITLLGRVHRRPDLTLPALAPLLHYTNGNNCDNVRNSALCALGEFGPAARPAFDEVARLLKDRTEWIRTSATNTLRQIDPQAAARAGVKPDPNDLPADR